MKVDARLSMSISQEHGNGPRKTVQSAGLCFPAKVPESVGPTVLGIGWETHKTTSTHHQSEHKRCLSDLDSFPFLLVLAGETLTGQRNANVQRHQDVRSDEIPELQEGCRDEGRRDADPQNGLLQPVTHRGVCARPVCGCQKKQRH